MTQTQELEREIRGFINSPRKHGLLYADRMKWATVCSSLNAIGDTELALESYLARTTPPADTGELYILMYGVLQVLYVQQDAVKHISAALSVPYSRTALLTAVRDTRNAATGHPTRTWNGDSHFISRITMHEGGFQMMAMCADGSNRTRRVNVPQEIAQQRTEVSRALEAVVNSLRTEETTHRRAFRGTALGSFLPPTLAEGISSTSCDAATVEAVASQISRLEGELRNRDLLDGHSSAVHFLADVGDSLTEVRAHFAQPGVTPQDVAAARLDLAEKLRNLAALSAEIDATYSADA